MIISFLRTLTAALCVIAHKYGMFTSCWSTNFHPRIITLKVLISDSNVSFLCIRTSSTLSNCCARSTNTSITSLKSREFNCANERRWTMLLTRISSSFSTIISADWLLTCNSRSNVDALWRQNLSNDFCFFCFFFLISLLLLNKTVDCWKLSVYQISYQLVAIDCGTNWESINGVQILWRTSWESISAEGTNWGRVENNPRICINFHVFIRTEPFLSKNNRCLNHHKNVFVYTTYVDKLKISLFLNWFLFHKKYFCIRWNVEFNWLTNSWYRSMFISSSAYEQYSK